MKYRIKEKVSKRYSGIILISPRNEFILQKRERKLGISNPGLITTFGGVCKQNESHIDCVIREINEELNYTLNPKALSYFLDLIKSETDDTRTHCKFFICKELIDPNDLVLREGEEIALLKSSELEDDKYDLSEVCRTVLRKYISRKNGIQVQ